MIWFMVAGMVGLVIVMAGQAVMMASLRDRVDESEAIITEFMNDQPIHARAMTRLYVARWGYVAIERENA